MIWSIGTQRHSHCLKNRILHTTPAPKLPGELRTNVLVTSGLQREYGSKKDAGKRPR